MVLVGWKNLCFTCYKTVGIDRQWTLWTPQGHGWTTTVDFTSMRGTRCPAEGVSNNNNNNRRISGVDSKKSMISLINSQPWQWTPTHRPPGPSRLTQRRTNWETAKRMTTTNGTKVFSSATLGDTIVTPRHAAIWSWWEVSKTVKGWDDNVTLDRRYPYPLSRSKTWIRCGIKQPIHGMQMLSYVNIMYLLYKNIYIYTVIVALCVYVYIYTYIIVHI